MLYLIDENMLPEFDKSSLIKKLLIIVAFFTLTPITLVASMFSLSSSANIRDGGVLAASDQETGTRLYASLPPALPEIVFDIDEADARPSILKNYLSKNNSPLSDHSDTIVNIADKYQIDWKLLTAIAMKESGGCRVIPEGSHNCWGWGIHSKGTLMFDSYPQAIETVSKGLKEKYYDLGYVTPEEIMKKYAHPDSTTWADGIRYYMDRLK